MSASGTQRPAQLGGGTAEDAGAGRGQVAVTGEPELGGDPRQVTLWMIERCLRGSPRAQFALLAGSVEETAAQLVRQARELGITRYVVREPAVEAASRVLSF